MRKLSKATRNSQRRKLRLSTAAENKLLAVIKRFIKLKLPQNANLTDYIGALYALDFAKLNPYIRRYAMALLMTNQKGFINIVNALVEGKSANKKAQERLSIKFNSFAQEQIIFKPLLDKFERNVKLIKRIPDEVARKLREAYSEGVSFRGNEIERYLTEKLGTRARLIVRTESSKLNSALTEIRAKSLQIPGYVWSTSSDQRVRSSHKVMDGVLVFWDTILTLDKMTGHAGEYPNCRCVGIPVVELDDLQFPIKVAEGNLTINSKYVKGSHGKKYDVNIISGKITTYTREQFMKKYGKQFSA